MADSTQSSEDAAKALSGVSDVLKLVTSLATGAFVFSIGLASTAAVLYPIWLKIVLILSWAALLLAVICGVAAQSYIPRQWKVGKPDIDSADLKHTAGAMEILFVVGIALLSVTLSIGLFAPSGFAAPRARTATEAVRTAVASTCRRVSRVSNVQLIKGEDGTNPMQDVWDVTFVDLAGPKAVARTEDVFVDADGVVVSPVASSCKK